MLVSHHHAVVGGLVPGHVAEGMRGRVEQKSDAQTSDLVRGAEVCSNKQGRLAPGPAGSDQSDLVEKYQSVVV